MNTLIILNDPPYGTERSYNGLRLALALKKREGVNSVTVFLIGDAVLCANTGQKTPDGAYNIERMVKGVATGDGQVMVCGTCLDARGLSDEGLVKGARRSTMSELAEASAAADKVMVF